MKYNWMEVGNEVMAVRRHNQRMEGRKEGRREERRNKKKGEKE
jgi:hypothetical protein